MSTDDHIAQARRISNDLSINWETSELPGGPDSVPLLDMTTRDEQTAALVRANNLNRNEGTDPTGERLRHKIMRCGGPGDDDGPREQIELVAVGTIGDGCVTVYANNVSIRVPFAHGKEVDTARTPRLILSIPVKR
jgi:hypothetical protein